MENHIIHYDFVDQLKLKEVSLYHQENLKLTMENLLVIELNLLPNLF